MRATQTKELELPEVGTTDMSGFASRVILFNDDFHTFDEVTTQIIKAVACSYERAEELTWEVHNRGKACVYEGELEDCLRVSSVLEEIALHTQIEY